MRNRKERVYQYTVFFEANEHRGYTVVVPALPGLVTEGKSLEHARRMAEDAIRCYIEGLKKAGEPVPFEGDTAQLRLGGTSVMPKLPRATSKKVLKALLRKGSTSTTRPEAT